MKVDYQRDFQDSYVILEGENLELENSYRISMLEKGEIPGLLSCEVRRIDRHIHFYYKTTTMQSLETMGAVQKLGYENLNILLLGLIKLADNLESYLLSPAGVQLAPDLIFFSKDKDVQFCWFPQEGNIENPLLALAEYLLPKIDHQDKRAVGLGYTFYRQAMDGHLERETLFREVRKEDIISAREAIRDQRVDDKKTESEDSYRNEQEEKEIYAEVLAEREKTIQYLLKGEARRGRNHKKEIIKRLLGFLVTGGIFLLASIFIFMKMDIGKRKLLLYLTGEFLLFAALIGLYFLIHKLSEFLKEKLRERKKEKKGEEGNREGLKREPVKEQNDKAFAPLWLESSQSEGEFFGERGGKEDRGSLWKKRSPEITDDTETEILVRKEDRSLAMLKALEPTEAEDIQLDKADEKEEKIFVLGTLAGAADIILPSAAVSRLHAKIEKKEGSWLLYDLNSRNGTFVNDYAVVGKEGRVLEKGDRILFGNILYRFEE